MATRKFYLNQEAIDALKQAEKATKKTSELRWMQSVRLYGSGQAVAQIAEMTRLSGRTILRCVERYEQKGIAGLYAAVAKGNRSLLTDEQRAELARKLHQYRPVDLHISQRAYWTVSDLAVAVEQEYGVVYKDGDSYQHLLHASGFTFQRSAKAYRHKPSAAMLAEFQLQLEKK